MENSLKYLFVVGNPVSQSLSPLMINSAIQYLKQEDNYFYFSVETEKIDTLKKMFHSDLFLGASVTMPFKAEIKQFIKNKNISKEAKMIDAINVVYKKDNDLCGHNTDWIGIMKSLEKEINIEELKNKKCLILGSGGASRSCIYVCKKIGMDITVFSRTKKSAKDIFPNDPKGIKVIDKIKDTLDIKLIMNATPVGMKGKLEKKSPIREKFIHKEMICYDCIYNPKITRFLRDAELKGAKIIDGMDMLVFQGAEAFRLWTGNEPPIEIMKKAIEKRLDKPVNI